MASAGFSLVTMSSMRRQMLAPSMPDAQHIHRVAVDGEEYPVQVRPVAIKQLLHFKRDRRILQGKFAAFREAIASSSFRNQRSPVSPACCESSHFRMALASRFAAEVISKRKAML